MDDLAWALVRSGAQRAFDALIRSATRGAVGPQYWLHVMIHACQKCPGFVRWQACACQTLIPWLGSRRMTYCYCSALTLMKALVRLR
jgi:hypothetical protein